MIRVARILVVVLCLTLFLPDILLVAFVYGIGAAPLAGANNSALGD